MYCFKNTFIEFMGSQSRIRRFSFQVSLCWGLVVEFPQATPAGLALAELEGRPGSTAQLTALMGGLPHL